MSWIRRNPFTEEDPVQVMIDAVAVEAENQGSFLSAAEKELLAQERYKSPVDPLQEERLKSLVNAVVLREINDAEINSDYRKRSFLNAIEWAGDLQYPYVVQLAERSMIEYQDSHGLRKERVFNKIVGILVLTCLLAGGVYLFGFATIKLIRMLFK